MAAAALSLVLLLLARVWAGNAHLLAWSTQDPRRSNEMRSLQRLPSPVPRRPWRRSAHPLLAVRAPLQSSRNTNLGVRERVCGARDPLVLAWASLSAFQ